MFLPVGIEFALTLEAATLVLHAYCSEDTEHRRNIDEGEHRGDGETADDADTQRTPHLGTDSMAGGHWHHTEDGGE